MHRLLAVVPAEKMHRVCSLDDVYTVVVQGLQLRSYYKAFACAFAKENQECTLPSVFATFDKIWGDLPSLENGFDTRSNVKTVQAALYLYVRKLVTIENLKSFVKSYEILDSCTDRNGAPANAGVLFRAFLLINRFIPGKIIEYWLTVSEKQRQEKDSLLPSEFLFLAANTYALKSLEKRFAMYIKKDKKTDTYIISDLNGSQDQPRYLDKELSKRIDLKNIVVDFGDSRMPTPMEFQVPAKRNSLSMNPMKDPHFFKRINATLKLSDRMLLRIRSNSRFSTTPFGDAIRGEAKVTTAPVLYLESKCHWSKSSRPTTATSKFSRPWSAKVKSNGNL